MTEKCFRLWICMIFLTLDPSRQYVGLEITCYQHFYHLGLTNLIDNGI